MKLNGEDRIQEEVVSASRIRRVSNQIFGGDKTGASKKKISSAGVAPGDGGFSSDEGLTFGIKFDVKGLSNPVNLVAMPDTGITTLMNLFKGLYFFLQKNPALGLRFLAALEMRSTTAGYPEFAAGEKMMERAIESIFLSIPSEKQIQEVSGLFNTPQSVSISFEQKKALETYFIECTNVLTRLSLQRLNFLVRIMRNISRGRYEFNEFTAALHLNYVENSDVTPY